MKHKFIIGEVLKPQGVAGALKIKPFTDDPLRFRTIGSVFIGDVEYKVLNASVISGAVVVTLKGIADRDAAERLRGKLLEISREDAAPLEEGRCYIEDVIGCDVVTDTGRAIGRVVDITVKPYADIYALKSPNGKDILFPLLKDLLIGIDVEKGTVTVREKRFEEVAVYED